MKDLKWWGSLCLALMLALPLGVAQADDDDDDDRWEERDDDRDEKKKKRGKKHRDDDDDDEDEGEIELDSVRYKPKKNLIRIKGELDDFDARRTEVVVSESAFGTELASKSVRENFKFKIELEEGQPVPCSVVVSAGDVSVTAPVRKAPETCDKFTKTITGLVTDGPIPFAAVTVTIDGVTYTTTADELGQYALDIATSSVGDLVKVEASGTDPETGTPIEFVNFAGSFERVLGDEPQNVTNVTTASFVLAVAANDGTEPTTLEELQAAETAIDATELFELAAVIKLLVDDPTYELPAGFDNVLDFASDSAAVSDFVATADPADLDQAVADILADSNLVAGFTADKIPSRYFAIPTANPGFLARDGSVLEFNAGDQTGTLLDFNSPAGQPIEQAFTWVIENGRLVLTFATPAVSSFFPFVDDSIATQEQIDLLVANSIFQVQQDRAVSKITYTLVTAGSLVDIVAVEEVADNSFPPIEVTDPVTGDPVTVQLAGFPEIDNSTDTLRSADNVETIPFAADCATAAAGEICAPGRWGGIYRYSAGEQFGFVFPETAYGEVVTLDASGGAIGVRSGVSSTWTVVDGSLVISYAGGAQQTVTLLDNNGIEYGALSEFTTPEGRFASYDLWVKADTSFAFTESFLQNPPGQYWQGDINTWIPGSLDENGNRTFGTFFGWRFDAAPDPNEGENLLRFFFDENGDGTDDNVLARRPNIWSVESERVRIVRFLGGFGLGRVRFWYPITATEDNGERVTYILETEVFEDQELGEQMFIVPRLNIERELNIRTDFDAEIFIDLPE